MPRKIEPEEISSIHRRLDELVSGDQAIKKKIIRDFLEFFPSALLDFEKAKNNTDSLEMIKIAHSLKSTVSFLGISKVFLLAKVLEELLVSQEREYGSVFMELTEELERLKEFFLSYIGEK